MREHLRGAHQEMAAHHVAMAKTHRRIAEHFGKSEMAEGSKDLASSHDELAGHHTDQAEYHIQCCKSLDKSLDTEDLSKAIGLNSDGLRPDLVSSVIGEVPENLRPVFRNGQRDFAVSKVGAGSVLEKIFAETEE